MMDRLPLTVEQKESVILWPWEIKGPIEGPAVMFDVLAASYNVIHLVRKASRLFTVTKDSVRDAVEQFPDALLIGETDDPTLSQELREKFVSSNSPVSVVNAPVIGKIIILITNNGTHTVSELIDHHASPVIIGHWINISAVVDYLLARGNHGKIHLIPSGGREQVFTHVGGKLMEDYICAEAMCDLLMSKSRIFKDDFRRSRDSIAAQYPVPQKENELAQVFQVNTTDVVPICHPISSGIIEVKT